MSTDLPGTGIELVEEPTVYLVDLMGSDASICQAAWVSTVGENEDVETERDRGLINYLVKNRHGSPFEHATLKFYVDAPIFVFREFHQQVALAMEEIFAERFPKTYAAFWENGRQPI